MGRLRLSKTGAYTIGLTLLVGLAAINTLNNMLFIAFGALLSVILTSGFVSEQTLFRLKVQRRSPSTLYAQEPASFDIKVLSRHRWIPAYALEVEEASPTDESGKRCFFLKIDPGQEQSATYRRSYETRGEVHLHGLWLRTSFPFGMFEKAQWIPLPDALVVYPAIHPIAHDDVLPGTSPHQLSKEGTGDDLHSAREFREGDDARDILWGRSASARTAVVRVRQTELPAQIDVHVQTSQSAGPAFETHISDCASMLVHAHERGIHASLHQGDNVCPITNDEQLRQALHQLALIEPDFTTPLATPS